MELILTFCLGFSFSFIGSIPPGTLNLTIIQLGLEHHFKAAWRFAIAVAVIEYPYGWLAIRFADLISSSPAITENIQLGASFLMIILGLFNLWSAGHTQKLYQRFHSSGFRRGIVLSILNPLALPFWIGVTAYLKGIKVIDLSSATEIQTYLIGISLGALTLMILLAYTASRTLRVFQGNSFIKKIPGIVLLLIGIYGLYNYAMN